MDSKVLARRSKWRLILTFGTFLALIILIYSLRRQIGDVISNLGRVNAAALLLMIPLQIWNYDAYARFLRSTLAILGQKVSYRDMFRFTIELNFVNHILPSGGISGISYFNVRARSVGVSTSQASLAQLIRLLLLYISFQPLLILGLFFLALRGHVNDLILIVTSSIITLLIVGTLAGIYIIESRSRINAFLTAVTKILNKLVHFIRPKHPETISIDRAQAGFNELHDNYKIIKKNWRQLRMPFVYTFMANVSEVATLYVVYIAFGRLVNVGAVILAYAVANFAGLISVLPAGIGIYEGLMTAVLVATGIPAPLSIPVTIMYRVINMLLQLTPGYYFYQKAVASGLGTKV